MLVLLRLMVITVRERVVCGCNRLLRHSIKSLLILLMIPPPVALCAPPFPTSRGDPHQKSNQILKRTNGGPRVANSCRKVDLGIAQADAVVAIIGRTSRIIAVIVARQKWRAGVIFTFVGSVLSRLLCAGCMY